MLFGAGIVLHRVMTLNSDEKTQLRAGVALAAALSVVIWAHIKLGHSALHQITFVTMIGTVNYKTFSLISGITTDDLLRRRMKTMSIAGSCKFFFWYSIRAIS